MGDGAWQLCYGSGLIDGLLLARRLLAGDEILIQSIDDMLNIAIRMRSTMLLEEFAAPSQAMAEGLLDLGKM